jgi:AcrR family transcriptional regulator
MSYEGAVYLTDLPRARLLHAVGEIVHEHGYGRLSMTRLTNRAGVSQRTFNDLFEGTEDCFLQAFEGAIVDVEGLAGTVYGETVGPWRVKVREALAAILAYLDEHPVLCALLIVESGRAGPLVTECHAVAVRHVGRVLHESAVGTENGGWLPVEDGECTVQSLLTVMRAVACEVDRRALSSHLDLLMSVLVLRYEGPDAARRELARSSLTGSTKRKEDSITIGASDSESADDLSADDRARSAWSGISGSSDALNLKLRVTHRTLRVLEAIAELGQSGPYPSNTQVADRAGIADLGQASKLLRRLQEQELIKEVSGNAGKRTGAAYQWRLTQLGEELERVYSTSPTSRGGRPVHERRREHR